MLKFSGCSCLISGRMRNGCVCGVCGGCGTHTTVDKRQTQVSRDDDASGNDRAVFREKTYQVVALRRGRRSSHCASAHPVEFKKRKQQRVPGPSEIPSEERTWMRGSADAEADMPLAGAAGARCVQSFDGSHTAIHTTYRISLRSSSIREPRYPLLRVVFG